jgi:DNA polymerase-4
VRLPERPGVPGFVAGRNKRSIIHLNVADFAVAVEQTLDARLRGRPVIVAPEGAVRAKVFDMSDEAYRAGIRKGMGLRQAQSLCRDAEILPPRPDRYERAMRALRDQARPYSPLIECADENGHLFIDTTGTGRLFGPPADVAWRIRKAVRNDLGFDPIWSVAPNKLIAKVASRLVKPTGEYIVEEGEEEAFLQPLLLRLLPGIETGDLDRLHAFHLYRVHEVTRLTLTHLEIALGKRSHAQALYEASRGIDTSPVLPVDQKRPVVTAEYTFGEDTHDRETAENTLHALVESVGSELRRRRLAARRLGVTVDYTDGVRTVRSASTGTARSGGSLEATANDFRLLELALLALRRAWTRRVRLRHLRLTADRLIFPPAQLDLFPEENRKKRQQDDLVAALDRIRERFGKRAIRVARSMRTGHP